MGEYFDIYGTRIPLASIKDFRVIEVEFVYRPIYCENKKTVLGSLSGKRFEFVAMQPYAAIIGQQGHKSALGEYKAKDFKEALGKDLAGGLVYTVADALKLKAFKYQKYQCLNLAGRAFTTYLDDVPVMVTWSDGRVTEVFKEDSAYSALGGNATPGIQYIQALVIKAGENYCFYGNGVQFPDATAEYERLKVEFDEYQLQRKQSKLLGGAKKIALPQIPKLRLPTKSVSPQKSAEIAEADVIDEKEKSVL